MGSPFLGFPAEALEFFRGLARHNKREWFQPRKPQFEEYVKQPMVRLVEALNRGLEPIAPALITPPEKAIYRIYRDTRFSQDKTPYKDHIAASFHNRASAGQSDGGLYLAISHKEVAVGGGVYLPEPAALRTIREHIAENHGELRRILASKTVKRLLGELQGEQLSRVPKGFACDHPAADLLRRKRYILYIELPAELATTPRLYQEIWSRFRATLPFLEFLTAPFGQMKKKLQIADLL
ncbi:MAG: DUF2461 domain-containing protein [Bryobacteraceae bacterium]|jgi:uncharacterized protein (TIGR02453 family)